ncbi:MAG: acyltransferase family protein, partial [Actinomycetes bacterium]
TQVNEFDSFIYLGGFLLLDLVCIVVIAVMVHPSSRVAAVMSVAPLVWIGKRSYSLYLWHWPIFQITRPDIDVPLRGLPLLVLRLALTFGAAELSYRYVETPLRKGALGAWWRSVRSGAGEDQQVAVRRGLAVGASFVLLVAVLGVGLEAAASSPDRARREAAALAGSGLVPTATPGDDPNAPDAAALAPPTTPTTVASVSSTSTTVAATTTAPLGPGQTATNAVAVGDSVMLGAKSKLLAAMPGIRVDAKVARQFTSVLSVASWYVQQGYVQGPLIVHLGTNGTFTDNDLDRLVNAAGGRRLILVNSKVNRPWQELVNRRIAGVAARHPGVVVVDWHAKAVQHPEWFVGDGTHLSSEGAAAFAEMIRSAL